MLGSRTKGRGRFLILSPYYRSDRNNFAPAFYKPIKTIKRKRQYRYRWLIVALSLGLCFVTTGVTEAKTTVSSNRSVNVLPKSEAFLIRHTVVQKTGQTQTTSTPSTNNNPAPVSIPVPQKPVLPQGALLVVNKDKFTLSLYQNGQKAETFSAGLGKDTPNTETPTGKFIVISRVNDPPYHKKGLLQDSAIIPGGDPKNPLGPCWLGLNIGINEPNSIGIHGTTAGAGVGQPQTEGCVQLNNTDICTLYNKVPLGTPVWIGTTAQLDAWGI